VTSVSELNKRKVQLFADAVLSEGRLELIDELIAADYLGHVAGVEAIVLGPDGLHQLVCASRRGNPDLYLKIEDQIAEDDRVAIRWHATIQPPASGDPEPPTRYSGISIIRLLAGKLVDSHTACARLDPADDALEAAAPPHWALR
jgi:predicted SnoaL-like aldol condensation-catalyzing enzyme